MIASTPATPGRIFISYRRDDAAWPAGWLFDKLAAQFGKDQVFKDVDSIQLGDDFVEAITVAVWSCDVLLALIGPRWLTVTDEQGQRRLDNPHDFVRLEVGAALARNIRVIPVLVDGARMPGADQLPENLAQLARRHALELSPHRFSADTDPLQKVLEMTIAEVKAANESADDLHTEQDRIDTRALSLAARILSSGTASADLPGSSTLTEFEGVIDRASSPILEQIYEMTRTQRSANWNWRGGRKDGQENAKKRHERTVPIFRILCKIAPDDYRYRGDLGFSLKDKESPDYPESVRQLSVGIDLAETSGDRHAVAWYSVNRAVAQINCSEADITSSVAAQIRADIRYAEEYGRGPARVAARDATIRIWLSAHETPR